MVHYYLSLRTPFSILFFALAVVVGALVCLSVISVMIGFIRNALFPASVGTVGTVGTAGTVGTLGTVESVEYDEDLDRGEDIEKVAENMRVSYEESLIKKADPPCHAKEDHATPQPPPQKHIHLGDEHHKPPRVVTRTPMTTRTDVRKAKRKRLMAKKNKAPAKPAPANPQKNKRK